MCSLLHVWVWISDGPSHTLLLLDFSGKFQEKVIFLVFSVSVVSKESRLKELWRLGSPLGSASYISLGDGAETWPSTCDIPFHVEQFCPQSSYPIISVLPFLVPCVGACICKSHQSVGVHAWHPHSYCCGCCREVKRYGRDQETEAHVRGKSLSEQQPAFVGCACAEVLDQMTSRGPLWPRTSWSCKLVLWKLLFHKFSSRFCWEDPYFCTPQVEISLLHATQQPTSIATRVWGSAWAPATAIPFSTLKDKMCILGKVASVSFNLAFLILALRSPSRADTYLGLMGSPPLSLGELANTFRHIHPKTFYCIWILFSPPSLNSRLYFVHGL